MKPPANGPKLPIRLPLEIDSLVCDYAADGSFTVWRERRKGNVQLGSGTLGEKGGRRTVTDGGGLPEPVLFQVERHVAGPEGRVAAPSARLRESESCRSALPPVGISAARTGDARAAHCWRTGTARRPATFRYGRRHRVVGRRAPRWGSAVGRGDSHSASGREGRRDAAADPSTFPRKLPATRSALPGRCHVLPSRALAPSASDAAARLVPAFRADLRSPRPPQTAAPANS